MGHVDEGPLHRPDVPRAEPPVDAVKGSEVEDSVPVDTSRHVDVRVEIAPHEVADRSEHGLAAEKSWVAGLRDGAPPPIASEHEDDVIEVVNRLHIEEEWRVSVLLQDHGGRKGGLEAVRSPEADDDAKRPERLASLLEVVREPAKPFLHEFWRAEPLD